MPPKRSSDSDKESEAEASEASPTAPAPAEEAAKPEREAKPVPEKKLDNIPDSVDYFLGKLKDSIGSRNVPELHKLYEDEYNKVKTDHYKSKRWPSAETVAEKVSSEPLFLLLYKELYYRHVYCELQVTYDDRKGSWENYCKLLDLIIRDLQDKDKPVALPATWIWDLLDEFVYHYQTYCTTRSKVVRSGKEDLMHPYKENPDVFLTTKVLTYLHQLVRYSKVEEYLANKDAGTGASFTDETTRFIGYFSLMQLLRMHSLLGDYHLAMKTIQCIDFTEEVPLFYKIPACHVTLYYYMGFAYMMMRRYADAIRTFSEILVFLSKIAGMNSKSYQYEAMVKKHEQMYALLIISLALCPRPIDESLEKKIRGDQWAEKQARLQRGEEICFEELFGYAAPKFVAAAPPNFEKLDEFNANEAHQRPAKLFLQEVRQQQFLPRIDSYMKLYTAIKIEKLAQLCEMAPDALRDQLMCVMHKTSQKVRSGSGRPLDGEPMHCSEVEFYLDGDMVHINAQRTEREHTDVFLEQILKFQDLLKKMSSKEAEAKEAKVAAAVK